MLETQCVGPELQVVVEEVETAMSPALTERVETTWAAARTKLGDALFEGSILSLLRQESETLICRFVPYSHLIAQRSDPSLYDDLGVRPLAVTGLLAVDEGYVFGLRGADVALGRGLWELAPSGSIDPASLLDDGSVDVLEQLCREVEEELNVPAASLRGLRPFALIYDPARRLTEIGIAGRIACDAAALHRTFAKRQNREYDELAVVPDAGVDSFDGHGKGSGVDPVSHALVAAIRASRGQGVEPAAVRQVGT